MKIGRSVRPHFGPMFEALEPRLLLTGSPAFPATLQSTGIGGGGGMFQVTVSPFDSQYVHIASDVSGDYRSTDGGANWQMIPYKQIDSSISLRPAFTATKTYWADTGTGYLMKSLDKGVTWSRVGTSSTWGTGISDLAVIDGGAGSDKLFAGSNTGLWQSQNAGTSWTSVSSTTCNDLAVVGNTVYAALGTTLKRSTDGGVTWSTLTITGVSGATISSVAAVQVGTNPITVYAIAASNGTYRSTDGGTSWTRIHTWNGQTDVQVPAGQTTKIYECQEGSGGTTVWGTTNSGTTWSSIFRMDGSNPNVTKTWIQTQLYWGYYITAGGLGVAPSDPNILYLATQGELYKSTDGGATWHGDMAIDLSGNRHQSIGLEVTTTWDYKIDPNNHAVQFICYTDVGFARSTDSGATWAWSDTGNPWVNTMYEIVFDPFTPNKIYGAASNLHDISTWNAVGNNSGSVGGVVVSTNDGVNWSKLGSGFPAEPCTDIMIDRSSTAGHITLWATSYYTGVYKSTDGGATWVQKSNGVGRGANHHAYHIAQDSAGNLYCLVAGLSTNTFADHGGLYRSTDGGETWTDITASRFSWPTDMAIVDASTIYVSAAAGNGYGNDQSLIWKTTDGGTTWTQMLSDASSQIQNWHTPSYAHTNSVDLFPGNPNIVFCSSGYHGLWVSLDAGATWSPYPNLPFQGPTNVSFDPADPTMMYVTTFGGGVWKGWYLPIAPGDANRDGIVDQADYTRWYNSYGADGGWAGGDFNGDKLVDQADYTLWYNNYGSTGGAAEPVPAPVVTDEVAPPAEVASGIDASALSDPALSASPPLAEETVDVLALPQTLAAETVLPAAESPSPAYAAARRWFFPLPAVTFAAADDLTPSPLLDFLTIS